MLESVIFLLLSFKERNNSIVLCIYNCITITYRIKWDLDVKYAVEHSVAICVQLETNATSCLFIIQPAKRDFDSQISQQNEMKSFGEKLIEVANVSYLSYCKLNSVDPDVKKGWSIIYIIYITLTPSQWTTTWTGSI